MDAKDLTSSPIDGLSKGLQLVGPNSNSVEPAAAIPLKHEGTNGIVKLNGISNNVEDGDKDNRPFHATNGLTGPSNSLSNSRAGTSDSSRDGFGDVVLDRPSLTADHSLHSHKSCHGKSRTWMPKPHLGTHKRIIVCCDGTWQDGIEKKYRWQYSNILKLARAFHREDRRQDPPIQQIVFYQAGVGTDNNLFDQVVGGATGAGLGEKVQDAYAFIAHNYQVGDEVVLLGFSRGAYTARMVAAFIGAIGILDKSDMDHFAEIFISYQKLGKETDETEKKKLNDKLKRFTDPGSKGKRNAEDPDRQFSIKCLAVFDTVGALGLPGELVLGSPKTQLFGFNDLTLGAHVERALQALALNEQRKDFTPATWVQSDEGRKKGQVLHQCWFTGSHSDIGGGYEFHDLSDITLTWMVANFEDIIAMDMEYIQSLLDGRHIAAYGEQTPHDSSTGVFTLADEQNRPLPASTDDTTHETIHPSALNCNPQRPDLADAVKTNPDLVWKMRPFEELVQKMWTFDANKAPLSKEARETAEEEKNSQKSFISSIKSQTSKFLARRKTTLKNGSVRRNSTMMNGASVKIAPEPKTTSTVSWFGSLVNSLEGMSG